MIWFNSYGDLTNTIVNALVAIGTIALAFIAIFQIRQSINERRKEKLNEIVEWANNNDILSDASVGVSQ
jgi:hypothetical protein